MHLPALATASFDTEIPLVATPLTAGRCTPQQIRETRLALTLLAAPVEASDDSDPRLQRLEAKLDLLLELNLQARYPERPELTRCRLGLDAIAWHSPHPFVADESLRLDIFPQQDSSLALYLAVRVTDCQPASTGFLISASVLPTLDQLTVHLWEKWVFRCHRRAIMGS